MNSGDFSLFDELALLASATYDAGASRCYDLFSGGFYWTDEFPEAFLKQSFQGSYLNRLLIAHRASLILGGPGQLGRFPDVWDALKKTCPHWPGLREERSAPSLAAELEATNDEALLEFKKGFDD